MKVIFLNTWHAKLKKELFEFISKNADDADIFCFFEVTSKMFSDFSEILTNFKGEYVVNTSISGQSIFVRKDISVISHSKVDIYKQEIGDSGCLQKIKIKLNLSDVEIGCAHGKAQPGSKLDTDIRLRQSQIILKAFKDKDSPKIIGGDFNLMPQTKSVKMFEEAGYRNLIKEFNIKDTRGNVNHSSFGEKDRQYFADYVFVSPEVKVKSFEVPNVEISDHLPLILEFDV